MIIVFFFLNPAGFIEKLGFIL